MNFVVQPQRDVLPREHDFSTGLQPVAVIAEHRPARGVGIALVAEPEEKAVLREAEYVQEADHVINGIP